MIYAMEDILGMSYEDQERARMFLGKECYFGETEEEVLFNAKIDFRKNVLYVIDDTHVSNGAPYGYEYLGWCPHCRYIIPCKEMKE